MRTLTRRERYDEKRQQSRTFPFSLVTCNFMHDGNLAYIIRAAACFGAESVHVIGSVPSRKELNPLSGSTYDYVKIVQHSSPSQFLEYVRLHDCNIISAELDRGSIELRDYQPNIKKQTMIVLGHEELGVPVEILQNSTKVFIPMPGVGFCLNTSQTGNIMLYEMVNKYMEATCKQQ